MKQLFFLIPFIVASCVCKSQLNTQVVAKVSGLTKPLMAKIFLADNDSAVWEGEIFNGTLNVQLKNAEKSTAFVYLENTLYSVDLKDKVMNISDIIAKHNIPNTEDLLSANNDVFPLIDKRFFEIVEKIKKYGVVTIDNNTDISLINKYFSLHDTLVNFTDSIAKAYPTYNAALFTIFRLAKYCNYSSEVYSILQHLSPELLTSNFAKNILEKKKKWLEDSIALSPQKLGTLLLKDVNGKPFTITSTNNSYSVLLFYNDITATNQELLNDIKRLQLQFQSNKIGFYIIYKGVLSKDVASSIVTKLNLSNKITLLQSNASKLNEDIFSLNDNMFIVDSKGNYVAKAYINYSLYSFLNKKHTTLKQ